MKARPFTCLYAHDFVRLAAATPAVRPAEPAFNAEATLALIDRAEKDAAALVVFPELGISAYAIDDLLFQTPLLDSVEAALGRILEASAARDPAIVVGAPLRWKGGLYNCAVVIHRGVILGVVPKAYLPSYREFYERRHFVSGAGVRGAMMTLAGREAPFGVDLMFRAEGPLAFTFHVEICEDLWTPIPPSSAAALAGAEVLVNLSASNIVVGKARERAALCAGQSRAAVAAYLYTAAGPGESTTDLAWDGQAGIFEIGETLAQARRFRADQLTVADVDLGRIRAERMRLNTFGDCAREEADRVGRFRLVGFEPRLPAAAAPLRRTIERYPFVPSSPARLAEDCYEAYNIQVQGLATRLKAVGLERAVIGVSGGLDSTQALIVAARAMDTLGLPRSNVLAFSLPGFATSEATRTNAKALIAALGATADEIDIRPAGRQMLADIGHPFAKGEPVYDLTFENVQAGLRTDYLFRLANFHRALVVGTGDLSEMALGWCTYGVGDQMSHYNPNASVPKTLIQHLIRFIARSGDFDDATGRLLVDILATEISPELVPGEALQSTQAIVGPYALQDFNLFYLTRYGFAPSKIAFLALDAWGDAERGPWPENVPPADRRAYELGEIRHWLEVFLRRFFASQYKRSALPNGPKLSSGGSLSPRGDWRAPSDASAAVWLEELENNVPEAQAAQPRAAAQ